MVLEISHLAFEGKGKYGGRREEKEKKKKKKNKRREEKKEEGRRKEKQMYGTFGTFVWNNWLELFRTCMELMFGL